MFFAKGAIGSNTGHCAWRQRVGDHRLGRKRACKHGGQSTAPAKAFLNVLPQNSPLLLGLPAETSGGGCSVTVKQVI